MHNEILFHGFLVSIGVRMPLFGKLTIGRLDLHWTKCQEQKSRSSDAKRLVLVWWRAQLMADGD
jgi:hypothetical protein